MLANQHIFQRGHILEQPDVLERAPESERRRMELHAADESPTIAAQERTAMYDVTTGVEADPTGRWQVEE